MATLNTLRTRGGIIVSIVIGIALVAFLLGDLTSSGSGMSNAQKQSVGTIDGNKVSYLEYASFVDQLSTVSQLMSGQSALSSEELDNIREMAWEAMMMNYAYLPGFETMGIAVGDAEQTDMTTGEYISPVLSNIFVDRQTGAYSADMLRSFIANLDADYTGQSRMIWNYLQKQMVEQRQVNKYMNLLVKGVFVTDLEVEKSLADANEVYGANYIKLAYSSIPDSLVTVSDSEIKEYYNAHKKTLYKQSPTRKINYVLFDLLPSGDDYAQAEKTIAELAGEFKTTENPLYYAQANSHVQPDTRFLKESELDAEIAKAVFSKDEMYGPVLDNNTYTLARRVERKMMPDSLGAKHILLSKTDVKLRDSLLTAIKRGSNFEMLASRFSTDTNSAMLGGSVGVFTPEQMIPEFSEACIKAKVGDVFTVDSQFGLHIVKLSYKSRVHNKVQVATITYQVEPSSQTQQTAYAAASKFVNEAKTNFADAAVSNTLVSRNATLTPSDRSVRGVENSRELVRWVYNAKLGDLSPIVDVDGGYAVAYVTEVNEKEYSPLSAVSTSIYRTLIKQKKESQLAAKFVGATLEEAAAATEATIETVSGVKYADYTVGPAGYELKLIGAITSPSMGVGELSKPVYGNTGVYLFDVTNVKEEENATFDSEKVRLEAMGQSYLSQRINMSMVEMCAIEDFRVKFF
ncbi:MAG: SurA N-terminal domain-containing protein [Rikenellaceae bacterium]